jgi:predicted  nucleic acid-binding Zn-ribbon protein
MTRASHLQNYARLKVWKKDTVVVVADIKDCAMCNQGLQETHPSSMEQDTN